MTRTCDVAVVVVAFVVDLGLEGDSKSTFNKSFKRNFGIDNKGNHNNNRYKEAG